MIRADRKVEHGRVIHVLDLLKRAGVAKIAFAVSPSDKGGTPVEKRAGVAKIAFAVSPSDKGGTPVETQPGK